jgi:hypothetical protein
MDIGASLRIHPAPEGFDPRMATASWPGEVHGHTFRKECLPQAPVAGVDAALITVQCRSLTLRSLIVPFPKVFAHHSFLGARTHQPKARQLPASDIASGRPSVAPHCCAADTQEPPLHARPSVKSRSSGPDIQSVAV